MTQTENQEIGWFNNLKFKQKQYKGKVTNELTKWNEEYIKSMFVNPFSNKIK